MQKKIESLVNPGTLMQKKRIMYPLINQNYNLIINRIYEKMQSAVV